jgi:hypothetical protein
LKVEIFDDWFSIGHLLLGGFAVLTPAAFILYLFYQFVEFCWKRPRKEEVVENFLGDLTEFFLGLAFTVLVLRTLI